MGAVAPLSGSWAVRFGNGEKALTQHLTQSVVSENGMGFHYTSSDHPVVRKAVALARETGAQDILDLGAGRGVTASAITREVPGTAVMATDINEIGLRQLQHAAQDDGLPVTAQHFDAAAKKLPDGWNGSFDLVIAKDLYPFLTPQQVTKMLRNASNALKPGGSLLLTAPSTQAWTYQEAPKTGGNPFYRKLSEAAQKYNETLRKFFSYANIRYLSQKLEKAGLELTEAQPFGRENGWIMAVAKKKEPKKPAKRTLPIQA